MLQPVKTFPLFDTAIKMLQSMKDFPITAIGDSEDKHGGPKMYGRLAALPEGVSPTDTEALIRLKQIITPAMVEYLRGNLSEGVRSKVAGKNLSLSYSNDEHSSFVLHADTEEAVRAVHLDSLIKRIREVKDVMLGGKLGERWYPTEMSGVLPNGRIIGTPANPLCAKILSGGSKRILSETLDHLVNHYGLPIFSMDVPPDNIAIMIERSVLEEIKKSENVSDVVIGPATGGHSKQ